LQYCNDVLGSLRKPIAGVRQPFGASGKFLAGVQQAFPASGKFAAGCRKLSGNRIVNIL